VSRLGRGSGSKDRRRHRLLVTTAIVFAAAAVVVANCATATAAKRTAKITLRLSATSVYTSDRVHLHGTVPRNHAWNKIVIQRRRGTTGTWSAWKTVLITRASTYNAYWVAPRSTGRVSFRARYRGDARYRVSYSPVRTVAVTPQPNDLLLRTDFIYGIEIGEAETFEHGDCLDNATVKQRVRDLRAPVIRMAVTDTFTDLKRPDGKSGTLGRAALDDTVKTIVNLGAVPFVKFMPIDAPGGDYYYGGAWVPPLGDLGRNLPAMKAALKEIATVYKGPIVLESDNEGEIDSYKKWGFSFEGDVGVSAALGRKFALTMPALKKYARDTLGFSQVVTVGYVGVAGGPQWDEAITADASAPYGYRCGYRARSIDEFNNAVHAAYVAHDGDADYIPDAESFHTYGHNPDFKAAPYVFPDAWCYAFYSTWITKTRAHIASIWGGPGSHMQFSVSEWNAGAAESDGTWSGYSDPPKVSAYYTGWFSMLRSSGYWNANCYEVASEPTGSSNPNRFYNLINPNGTTPAWYDAFKAASTGAGG